MVVRRNVSRSLDRISPAATIAIALKTCTFSQNIANNTRIDISEEEPGVIEEGFGRGGGLCVVVDNNSSLNAIEIIGCNFTENSGIWGGALYIVIQGTSQSNRIEVRHCNFINNTCDHHAGGGVDLGYQAYHGKVPTKQHNIL